MVKNRIKGIMWWAMDLDDFSGAFCGQGQYPLISGVYKNLKEKAKQPKVRLRFEKLMHFFKLTLFQLTNYVQTDFNKGQL